MAYTHPDALQRVCDEIERTVWPSDRKFFLDHPYRNQWLRPATEAEVSEQEILGGKILHRPPGTQAITAVAQIAPGVRMRAVLVVPAIEPWREPPEEVCRAVFDMLNGCPEVRCAGLVFTREEKQP